MGLICFVSFGDWVAWDNAILCSILQIPDSFVVRFREKYGSQKYIFGCFSSSCRLDLHFWHTVYCNFSFSLSLVVIVVLFSCPYPSLGLSLFQNQNQPSKVTNPTHQYSYNCTLAQHCSISLSNASFSQDIANNSTILINITISDQCKNYTSCFRGIPALFFDPPNFVRSTHPPSPLWTVHYVYTKQNTCTDIQIFDIPQSFISIQSFSAFNNPSEGNTSIHLRNISYFSFTTCKSTPSFVTNFHDSLFFDIQNIISASHLYVGLCSTNSSTHTYSDMAQNRSDGPTPKNVPSPSPTDTKKTACPFSLRV